MKSFDFAKSFAWQVGIEPKKFAKLDYRLKKPNSTRKAVLDLFYGTPILFEGLF